MAGLFDVAIVGAGPVGAVLALALADADLDVVVVDARDPAHAWRGERTLAISHGARLILERVGVWGDLARRAAPPTPIVAIDISQAGAFGAATLAAADVGLPALGYVLRSSDLQEVLDAALQRTRCTIAFGAAVDRVDTTRDYAAAVPATGDPWLARLAAIADGSGARVRDVQRYRHDYRQRALVTKVWCRGAHDGVAYERFAPTGPVALLPEQDHYALVWTGPAERVEALLALPDDAFLAALRERCAPRRTDFVRVGERRSFALALEAAARVVAPRVALIGNAAQALHPVAAQGLNLGLRDAHALARIILDTPRQSIGSDAMLARYAALRRVDRLAGVGFTHGLLTVFGSDSPWLAWPRGVALAALDALRIPKRAFTRAMLFGLG